MVFLKSKESAGTNGTNTALKQITMAKHRKYVVTKTVVIDIDAVRRFRRMNNLWNFFLLVWSIRRVGVSGKGNL
jgi:hypothetical protein